MRILCFGAGAIGSYIGGSLALAGHETIFVDQPGYVPVLQKSGIQIEDIHRVIHRLDPVKAYSNPAEALQTGAFDCAIIAVKSFDTEALMESLKPYLADLPPFLCPQNGVENEEKLRQYLGNERVIPVSVCTAISRGKEGLIRVEKLRGIGISGGHALSATIRDAFNQAGLKAQICADGQAMKWSKMISNLIANASSAILDMTPEQIFSTPDSFRMEIHQLRETLAVMRALNIPSIDIPGVPIRLLCFVSEHLPLPLARVLLIKSVGSGRGGKMPSFYIDLYAGKKQSEVEYLNGAVVRAGKAQGIDVPVNQCYYEVLSALAAQTLPLETYRHDPHRLLIKALGK